MSLSTGNYVSAVSLFSQMHHYMTYYVLVATGVFSMIALTSDATKSQTFTNVDWLVIRAVENAENNKSSEKYCLLLNQQN